MIGDSLGPYQILEKLGEGGMGQVYRARDTKLNRQVALKVLPDSFASDPDRLARFTREAQTLASLNHPNIAHIHGLEESGGVRALVMELVDGEDLSERIARGAIPLDEALAIARQIADALEAAHEQGIVHRDLKPANIKLRADGAAKVLDFGLAKAIDQSSGAGPLASGRGVASSPTMTSPAVTRAGTFLGTAAYMAPEQARGSSVDKRADIWAFGVVLYEMLTGQRAFKGDNISEVIASVLRDMPDLQALPDRTPARVRRLLERCLDRDPKTRLRDVGEARVEIAAIERGAPDVAAPPTSVAGRSRVRGRLAWLAAAAMTLIALVVFGAAWSRSASTAAVPGVMRFAFVPPENLTVEDAGFDDIVVSPDGMKLVFTARATGGRRQLWVRSLDALDARALADTEDAIEPFWSPDSRSVGFGAAGKLKRVDLDGRRAQTLADAARLNGGSWSRTGVIAFKPDYGAGLLQVQASGEGGPSDLKKSGQWASFLPDGRRFFYNNAGAVFIGSLDSANDVPLPGVTNRVFYTPNPRGWPALPAGATGWLLFVKDGLMAQPFDADRVALAGQAVRVTTDAAASTDLTGGRRFISVSDTGVMVLISSQARDYQLQWVDRRGGLVSTLGPVTRTTSPTLPTISPDGSRVALQWTDPKIGERNIWVADVARGSFDRVTTTRGSQKPVWSPDGRRIFFTAVSGIRQVGAAGGDEQRVLEGQVYSTDISPDGKVLFYDQRGQSTRNDVWTLRLGDSLPSGTPRSTRLLLDSPFDEVTVQISRDGRWLAYSSDVSGTEEVYVRRFTTGDGALGEPTRISIGGGTRPRWRRDGAELYYLGLPESGLRTKMAAVAVKTSGGMIQVGAATPLFIARMLPTTVVTDYDVAPDGQTFLVGTVIEPAQSARAPAVIVLNWMAELTR